ncbi:MAG: hypothetical protein HQ536_02385 [Parcubacteria group bacterium]|nr:hypothetical protein [Parcubacteria group bacterium]
MKGNFALVLKPSFRPYSGRERKKPMSLLYLGDDSPRPKVKRAEPVVRLKEDYLDGIDRYGPIRERDSYRYFCFSRSVLDDLRYEEYGAGVSGFHHYLSYLPHWPWMMVVSFITMVRLMWFRLGYLRKFGRPVTLEQKEYYALGPKELVPWGYGKHPVGTQIRHCVRTMGALDPIYHLPRWLTWPRTRDEQRLSFVYQQPEARGVRNRLVLTYWHHRADLERLCHRGVLEIVYGVMACGSAEAVIYAVSHVKHLYPSLKVELHFVDRDEGVLGDAFELAIGQGIPPESVHCHHKDIRSFAKEWIASGRLFHGLDYVGHDDYSRFFKSVRYFKLMWRLLEPEGLLVTSRINRSLWSSVVRWGTNWLGLRRRMPWTIGIALSMSGFSFWNITLKVEPCLAHTIVTARKSSK